MAAISITATSVLPSSAARFESYPAAEAILAGQVVYLTSASPTTAGLADADASGKNLVRGIAVCSAPAAGQQVVVCTYDTAFAVGGIVAAGATVWLSATAGGITSTAADNSTGVKTAVIGIGQGSNTILLNPLNGGVAVP
jgi:hypothetical protein